VLNVSHKILNKILEQPKENQDCIC